MTALAAASLAALAAAFLVALLLERRSASLRLVDPPGGRKLQSRPVPLVGGVALLLGTAIGARVGALAPGSVGGDLLAGFDARMLVPPLGGFVIGLYDDVRGKRLSALMKAAGSAVVLVVARPVGAPLLDWLAWLPVAFVAMHAVNTIDHVHGLAGFVVALGAGALAVVAAGIDAPQATPPARAAAAVAGASCGFLFLNFPRGRVFLGDSGTLLLGGALASLLLRSRRPELLLLAAVPTADLLSVALLRLRAGARPWIGDRRHVTHRLIARGMPETRAVLLLALLQAACSAAAAVALTHPAGSGAAWALALGAIGLLSLGMLAFAPAAAARRSAADPTLRPGS